MSDYDDQLEAQKQAEMADESLQSSSVMGAAPISPPPSQIPVDPFGIEVPGDWAVPESNPPGFTPGNPLPGRPNVDPSPPQSAPEAPQVEPGEPIPETLRSPGNEVVEGGEGAVEGGEAAVEGGEAAVEGGEAAVEGGEALVEGGEIAAEGAELAEGGAALGELAPVAAAGIAGYAVGSAIAPYVYGDKNLDGSPVTRMENVADIDTDYKNSYAYKINQWLDD